MTDQYYAFLQKIRDGLLLLEQNPNLTHIDGIPRNTFDLLVRSFRSNADSTLFNGYSHNLYDQTYCSYVRSIIENKIFSYPSSNDPLKRCEYVNAQMPNLYNVVPAYIDAVIAKETGKKLNDAQKQIDLLINDYNSKIIQALENSLPPAEKGLHTEEIKATASSISKSLKSKFNTFSLSPEEEQYLIRRAIDNAVSSFSFLLSPPNLEGSTASDNNGNHHPPSLFNDNIENASKEVKKISQEAIEGFKNTATNEVKKTAENQDIRIAWSNIKSAVATSLTAPIPEPLLNFATAQIAYEMTQPGMENLTHSEYLKALEDSLQRVFSNPVLNFAVDPTVSVSDIALSSYGSIGRVTTIFSRSSRYQHYHDVVWQNSAYNNQHVFNNLDQDKIEDIISAPVGIPGSNTPPSSATGTSTTSDSGASFSTMQVATENAALQLFMSSGAPLNLVIAALDPNADIKLLEWIKGRPSSLFKTPFKIVPGFLDNSDYSDFIKFTDTSLDFYTKEIAKYIGQSPDKMSPSDFYSFMSATQAQKIIDEIKRLRNIPKFATAFKWYDRIQFWKHPLSNLKMRLTKHGLLPYSLAELGTSIPIAYLRYGGLGGSWVTEQYLKSFAILGFKALLAKTGLYKVYRKGPMGYSYELVFWHDLKIKIKMAIWKTIAPAIKKMFGKTIGKFTLGAISGGFGVAIGLLAILWWPLKQIGKFLSYALMALISKYGIAFIQGLVPGAFIGGGLGIWAGIKIGAAIGGAIGSVIPGLGTVAGAFVGGVIGFFTGLFTGAFLGGYLSVWLGTSIKTFFSTLGTQSASLISNIMPTSAINVSSLVVISLGGLTSVTAFTVFVTSAAFFSPSGQETTLGSRYIEINKGANVGGLINRKNLPNTIIGQKAVYTVQISPLEYSLKNVVIKDITTIINKSGKKIIAEKYLATETGDSFMFNGLAPSEWNKENDIKLTELSPSNPWKTQYGFVLGDEFKDSYVSNSVYVTGVRTATNDKGESVNINEEKIISLSFRIGNPPINKGADLAETLINNLITCYKGSRINIDTVTDNFNCVELATAFSMESIQQLRNSMSPPRANLQCIGFVQSVLTELGLPLVGGQKNANTYFNKNNGSYKWYSSSEFGNIMAGDIFVSNLGEYGHIAIVIEPVTENGFKIAEALGDTDGIVQTRDVPMLSVLNGVNYGFLRPD